MIYTGLGIKVNLDEMELYYGENTFGPEMEKRRLNSVRQTLSNPNSLGPDVLYSIAMDVGLETDKQLLISKNLLFGVCIYNKGQVGDEPIRSQGHVHSVSASCGSSTGELYEIWHGKAIVFMQENTTSFPGKVYAVEGSEGDIILVPPGWAHYTVNADISSTMIFGAWCVRDYGFDYDDVRNKRGLAYYPKVNQQVINFVRNPNYESQQVIRKRPRKYVEFNIDYKKPLYEQFRDDPSRFDFVSNPILFKNVWENFIP